MSQMKPLHPSLIYKKKQHKTDSWRMACIAVKGWALTSAACISLPFSS